jgi:hypothetical protein
MNNNEQPSGGPHNISGADL